MLEPHGQLFTLGRRVLVQGGDDLKGREEKEEEEVRPEDDRRGGGGGAVSFDIGAGVTRAVIVCQRHLGETDSPICLSILFISFCLSSLSHALSPSRPNLFFFNPPPQVAATHNGCLKKINSPSNFPIHIPEKCFQLKISYNHSSGI